MSEFQEEMESLIGVLTEEHHLEAAEFQIIHDDIRSKADIFFSSNWVDFWSKNFMLFLLIQDIKKIKR